MGSTIEILNTAKLRAKEMDLPYEGAFLPKEALTFLQENSGARLVDVRTFICRSGVRSNQAAIAAMESGYLNCFNVLEGFEGDKDSNGHRGVQGGWKAAGLPWVQS